LGFTKTSGLQEDGKIPAAEGLNLSAQTIRISGSQYHYFNFLGQGGRYPGHETLGSSIELNATGLPGVFGEFGNCRKRGLLVARVLQVEYSQSSGSAGRDRNGRIRQAGWSESNQFKF
jgi:hypothetical protein